MLSLQPYRTEKDRFDISVVPTQSIELDKVEDTDETKANDAIMIEVAAWLDLNERDGEHGSHRWHSKRVCPRDFKSSETDEKDPLRISLISNHWLVPSLSPTKCTTAQYKPRNRSLRRPKVF